ncbi:MAG TPA: hypothetical protein VM164_10485 [Burkholderiales bacterium]|nr:hypothetical protein [Burkholderiales bacterium]
MRKEFTDYDVWSFQKAHADAWNWRRTSPDGEVLLEGRVPFPSLDECMADARRHGYTGTSTLAT